MRENLICPWLALLALMTVGCEARELDLSTLAAANRIEVHSRSNEKIADVPVAQVPRAVGFVLERSGGWGRPWYGSPVAETKVVFFDGEKRLGTIGIGDSFLTTGAAGDLSRDISSGERREFLGILGLEPTNE